MAEYTRIMIVDDHPLFRSGLQKALDMTAGFVVVGASADGEQALIDVRQYKPDVLLLDINLPRRNGLQVAQQLRSVQNSPRIIFLTAYHDDEQLINAFGIGAMGYCTKDIHPDHLIQMITDVMNGYYVAEATRLTTDEFPRWYRQQRERQAGKHHLDENTDRLSPLSGREMEILAYVTDGMLNKEIANQLDISQQTVKNHMTSILKKMNVKDRTQAAVLALRRGWVRFNTDNPTEQPK